MNDANLGQELLSARILIVDDDPVSLLLLEKILHWDGYLQIRSTTDPMLAVEIHGNEPQDLVLLDMHMPHMDGLQVMQKLKEHGADRYPQVLVLTAQTDMQIRKAALDAGARDFINKPFERWEMLSRIRNLLEARLLSNRLRDQNARLEELVSARTRELVDTQLEIVRRLGRASEYRDNETGLHILRMSKIAARLAKQKGLSADECNLILSASPMHDIGKLGIPDTILLKPGKLDEEEWKVMRSHTTIGAAILGDHPSDLMKIAREIAIGHHEKWNGSGYPYGLAGEDIPLVSRIVAVADVFDALTSVRPYKHAWSIEEAMREIDRTTGEHFDPELVHLFHEILPDIIRIHEEYAEPDKTSTP